MRLLPATLLLAGLCAAIPPGAAGAEEPPRRITVTGSAEVEAVPDIATVSAGVETQAPEAAAALAANATAMNAVFAALEAAGIARADVQTSRLSLDSIWENRNDGGAPKVVGFQASNMVTVTVRDIARLGAVVDAVTAAGGNRIFGVDFAVDEPREQIDAARERAVADARAKAELYAVAAGVTLGAVLSISESGGSGPSPAPVFARAEAMADTPVAEGTVTLGASVEVVFAIE
ncbi:MAG TPA: SIMPL domain-containing protein [Amaricoccus sp.]|uniref:SIMPL domain-containing protein n=1 Tax=Amaricoccus sp. TaxID=1872485 RepID=UPI002B5450A6|nr:SIMPL domain-containing protein [Amaricoccus sp.]HMR51298.1 SIMPL domain-containing protein [Amaricoccus sp.]HMR60704.1 SIMPL domain-containing protein [Amaricoccus sp.]HMT98258.1 SIMPL domain-containing protein [Amaricoccus sp.]